MKLDAPVLVVGAGPVGLTLAIDLAKRGIRSTVLEARRAGPLPNARCNHISSRSMEIYRRLGIADRIRAAGLPDEFPIDGTWGPTFVAPERTRMLIPSRAGRVRGEPTVDTTWPTAEPPQRTNQLFFEPILLEHARSLPEITLIDETSLVSLEQDETGVTATARPASGGDPIAIRCDYLVGCDGGSSTTRHLLDVQLDGIPEFGRVVSTLIRAPGLLGLLERKPSWCTWIINPARDGRVFAIDGKELWIVHGDVKPDEKFEDIDRDAVIRKLLGVGPDFTYETITQENWTSRRLVAQRFRDRRVFLAGDAAHIWIPLAGYGMNAGIADATDLAWQLAGTLHGWGGAGLLDAYEPERLAITRKIGNLIADYRNQLMAHRKTYPMNGDAAALDDYFTRTYDVNLAQFFCAGFNYGYVYDESPIVVGDGGTAPPFTMAQYTPSTTPGARTPHVRLADGRSLYDALGPEWTLLRLDPAIDVEPLRSAAELRGVPLTVLDVVSPEAAVYDYPLVLSRPDQHIAWRGTASPADPLVVIDKIRGVRATP